MITSQSLTTADIVTAVDALVPEIRGRATEVAAGRRLPTDLVESLKRAGAFRMPMPKSGGGPEVPLPEQLRIVETLSAADPSTGWCVMIGSDAGFYSSFFEDEVARRLWPDLDSITAGWLFPAGRAVRARDGFLVSGHWAFGSCCLHADVMIGGCLVVDHNGVPEMGLNGQPVVRAVVAPATSFQILDTWDTTGLAGSGSNDYTCENLFVPQEHTFWLDDPVQRPEPLYAMRAPFLANAHGVPLGLARRAIDEVIGVAQTKVLMPSFTVMCDVPRVKEAVADAEMLLCSAQSYAYSALDAVWREVEAGRPLSQRLRADLTLSRVQSFRVARDVAMKMVQLAGTQAIYRTSVLDRLLRDAITMGQHAMASPAMAEAAGGLAMGIEPVGPMVSTLV